MTLTPMQSKRGSALITALFIMTMVAIIATAMSSRLQLDIHRTHLIQRSDRMYLASQAVTFWAIDRLSQPKLSFVAHDPSGQVLVFPKTLQTIYPNMRIEGELIDLQSKFNLNNVSERAYLPIFYGLLERLFPHLYSQERKSILDATTNWVNGKVDDSLTHNEWFERYSKQNPVYFPGYQFMQHVSEFRTVFGIDAKRYTTLLPFITALPEPTLININTAPKAILMSLGDGLSSLDADAIIKIRQNDAIDEFGRIHFFMTKYNIPQQTITLSSHYFLSIARVYIDDIVFTNYTVIKRYEGRRGKLVLSVLSESFNTR